MPSQERLKRDEWLRANGFAIDPFLPEAGKAESDRLFSLWGLPAFVDPPDFEKIRGNFSEPGPHYIISTKGGGKSSLRRRIKMALEQNITSPKALVVEYMNHEYSQYENDVPAHTRRITRLVSRALQFPKIWKEYQDYDEIPSKEWLEKLVVYSREHQEKYDGIFVLVDDLDIQISDSPQYQLGRILPLMTRNDLLGIDGLVIKYFLPDIFLSVVTGLEPKYVINLDEKAQLSRVLSQRLVACLSPELDSIPTSPLGLICATTILPAVEEMFLRAGEAYNGPRAMWKLGNFLFDEHFNIASDKRRLSVELINKETLQNASDRFLKDLQDSGSSIFELKSAPDFPSRDYDQSYLQTNHPHPNKEPSEISINTDTNSSVTQSAMLQLLDAIKDLGNRQTGNFGLGIQETSSSDDSAMKSDIARIDDNIIQINNDIALIKSSIDQSRKYFDDGIDHLENLLINQKKDRFPADDKVKIRKLLIDDKINLALQKLKDFPDIVMGDIDMFDYRLHLIYDHRNKGDSTREEYDTEKRELVEIILKYLEKLGN